MARQEEAVRYLTYNLQVPDGNVDTSFIVEVSRDLSLLNRRLYESGCRSYHVKSVTVMSSNTPTLGSRVRVSALPDTWMMRSALKRGCEKWMAQYNKAVSGTTSGKALKGKWLDFRPYLNSQHATSVAPLPVDADNNQIVAGTFEWLHSEMFVEGDPNSSVLTVLGEHVESGGNYSRIGLIKSWWQSRNRVHSGQPIQDDPSSDPLALGTGDGLTDEMLAEIEQHGDEPPYDHDNIIGAEYMTGFNVIHSKTIVDGYAKVPSFMVPCGAFRLDLRTGLPSPDTIQVTVELAAGDYRGIKAEKIA